MFSHAALLILGLFFSAAQAQDASQVADCLRDMSCRRLYAVDHRTGGYGAPENSLEGVRRAEAAGVKLIETDVRFAKDGTMVMLHDATLDRTTSLRGPVSERTWAELKEARLSDGSRLPCFEELYAVSRGRSVLVLDLKANAAERVAGWINAHGSFDDLIFFASDAATLASCARARSRFPKMMVMVRVEDGLDWKTAREAYGGTLPLLVHPHFPSLDLAASLAARRSKIYATVVGHDMVPWWRDDMARLLLQRGAVLIDTDDPAWLLAREPAANNRNKL
jgi:hypothetical protein